MLATGGGDKPLVILGSARPDGETRKAVAQAFPDNSADLVILGKIAPYDYDHRYPKDGFAEAVAAMLAADDIVFATPVYWYAMSTPLKVFFDRLTDLLEIEKAKGRGLAAKRVWLLATGTETELPEGFEIPFRRTAGYFDMTYRGAVYFRGGDDFALRKTGEDALKRFGIKVVAHEIPET